MASSGRRHSLPKPGLNSMLYDTTHLNNAQEQTAEESIEEVMEDIFGGPKTDDEIEFVKVLHTSGKLSLRILFLFLFTFWYISAVYLNKTALGPTSSFVVRCEITEFEDCLSFNQILDISVSSKNSTYKDSLTGREYCKYDVRDYAMLRKKYKCNYKLIKETIKKENILVRQESCTAFVIDNKGSSGQNESFALFTPAEELQLFCNNHTWNQLFTLVPIYGNILSFPFLATFADIFGRKPVFIISSTLHLLGLLVLLIPAKEFLIIGKLLNSGGAAACTILYVLFLELCSEVTVLWMGLLLNLFFPITHFIAFTLRYNVKHWKVINLINIALFIPLPFSIWYFTESPRWLMFTGNKTKAWEILQKCGSTAESTRGNLHSLRAFRRPRLKKLKDYFLCPIYRQRTIVFIILWFCTALSLTLGRVSIMDAHFTEILYYLDLPIFELILHLLIYVIAIKCGRRNTTFSIFSSLLFINAVIITQNPSHNGSKLLPLLVFSHHVLSRGILNLLSFYSLELFPTPFRLTAIGLCYFSFTIGVIFERTVIISLFDFKSVPAMYMPTCASTAISALIMCFLPSTQNKGLPDKLRDALYMRNVQ